MRPWTRCVRLTMVEPALTPAETLILKSIATELDELECALSTAIRRVASTYGLSPERVFQVYSSGRAMMAHNREVAIASK